LKPVSRFISRNLGLLVDRLDTVQFKSVLDDIEVENVDLNSEQYDEDENIIHLDDHKMTDGSNISKASFECPNSQTIPKADQKSNQDLQTQLQTQVDIRNLDANALK